MNTPVLFIVFNRIQTASRVFAAIRGAKPTRFYIAADGPRNDTPSDIDSCRMVRELENQVDWPCEVSTLFQKENLGCRHGPQAAIDWFFKNEKEGIILEDDCLPHPDFFKYCTWGLETYRSNKQVWQINGSNFLAPDRLYPNSNLAFTALAQVWGWATWRDRWQHYQGNPFFLHESAFSQHKKWPLSRIGTLNKLRHIDLLKNNLNTWDFQWQVTVLNHQGLCLSCQQNLITNIGDGDNATHTASDPRANLTTTALNQELKPENPQLNHPLTRWYEKHMGIASPRPLVKWSLSKATETVKQTIKNLCSRLLYRLPQPIIVASSGRSGSTMTADAIAQSLVSLRYKTKPGSNLNEFLFKRAQAFLPRLSHIGSFDQPILKTHDLYDRQNAPKAKYIFIVGDPLESAKSAEQMTRKFGHIWLDEHLYHLASKHKPTKLLQDDVLNFEQQVTSWLRVPTHDILILRFEEIWDNVDKLSRFVGFPVKLPTKKERTSKSLQLDYNKELFDRLQNLMEERIPSL